jgi:predicted chitinase
VPAILGDNLVTFIPGFRVLQDVARLLDPFRRKQKTFLESVGRIVPTTDEDLQRKLHGEIRTVRVPIEGEIKPQPGDKKSRTTTDRVLKNYWQDILISMLTGIYITRIDPKEVEAVLIREEKREQEKQEKENEKQSSVILDFIKKHNIFNPPGAKAASKTFVFTAEDKAENINFPYRVVNSKKKGYVRFYFPFGKYRLIKEKDIPKWGKITQKNFDKFNVGEYPSYAPNWLGSVLPSSKKKASKLGQPVSEVYNKVKKVLPKKYAKKAGNSVSLIASALEEQGIGDKETIAYALATTQHETANKFQPVNEGWFNDVKFGYEPGFTGKSEARKRGYSGGEDYYGRGYIQLTHDYNYETYGKLIGEDLLNNPDLANDPEIAAKILAAFFKTRGISKLTKKKKYEAARKLVNPDAKSKLIAKTARKYLRNL